MTNGYLRRKALRKLKESDRKQTDRMFFLMETHRVCTRYEDAYFNYFEVRVKASYSNGWFCVGSRRWRLHDFEEAIKQLEVKANARRRFEMAMDPQDD